MRIIGEIKVIFLNNGLLLGNNTCTEIDDAQLVVPEHELATVLSVYRNNPLEGHYGPEKTLQSISKRYFWPNMLKYIDSYVTKYIDCHRYKSANQKPAGLLQTIAMNQRYKTLAFDLFGPLPASVDSLT